MDVNHISSFYNLLTLFIAVQGLSLLLLYILWNKHDEPPST